MANRRFFAKMLGVAPIAVTQLGVESLAPPGVSMLTLLPSSLKDFFIRNFN